MRHTLASITQMLRLPSVCVICYQYHRDPYAACRACFSLLQQLGPACSYCALPLSDDSFLVCGRCSKSKPAFDRTFTMYRFEEPLRTLLHEYKYNGALFLRGFLVKLMIDALPQTALKTECLVPVPLHSKKLQERGFNQAAELAKRLAKHLQIPYELTLCKKILHTPSQMSLNRKERHRNLRHAFEVKANSYQHITLVDDLLTTGNTVNELATLFKKQGVAHVDVWCCARATT
ncbi:ComF family protein [Legionella cardiaca]|uniref:ComF family protein n=1 Tax=Legionella cardiaca TaxID=1071983 RepID=A0ABY8ANI8_9GAMM|nr:ComF family protein [Legionella cardiaca]WED42210.1 ComF family protein [Legionella cardiaca]